MKKQILLILFSLFSIFTIELRAQTDIFGASGHAGNTGAGAYYLGWDASTIYPIQIRQDNVTTPLAIEFWTSQLQRAEITGPEGFFGISDDWFSFYPDAQIHQNLQDGVDLWHHFTTGRTGLGFNAGFKVGLYDNGTAGWAEAHFEQWHYAPIITMLADQC